MRKIKSSRLTWVDRLHPFWLLSILRTRIRPVFLLLFLSYRIRLEWSVFHSSGRLSRQYWHDSLLCPDSVLFRARRSGVNNYTTRTTQIPCRDPYTLSLPRPRRDTEPTVKKKIYPTHNVLLCAPRFIIPLQHLSDPLMPKTSPNMLIHPTEHDSVQTIEFFKPDRRRRIPRTHPHDWRFDLRWRSKIPFTDFHEMFDSCEELDVGWKSAP